MTSILTEKRFEKLVTELKLLVQAAAEAASTERVRGYWEIGKRITQERISEEAGYHNSVLQEVAYATGISVRTLQKSVAFHFAYKTPPDDGLTWGHFQILGSLEQKAERSFYQKETVKQAWSVCDLRQAVRSDLYGGGELEEPALERPATLAYCYLARVERVVDGDTLDLDVDLGFRTWTKRRIRLAHVDTWEPKTAHGRAARNFIAKELARAKTVVIKSSKSDLYGRYLAEVFLSAEDVSLEDCFNTGRYLNDLLVQAGHATVV